MRTDDTGSAGGLAERSAICTSFPSSEQALSLQITLTVTLSKTDGQVGWYTGTPRGDERGEYILDQVSLSSTTMRHEKTKTKGKGMRCSDR